jgi:hypothetical protein
MHCINTELKTNFWQLRLKISGVASQFATQISGIAIQISHLICNLLHKITPKLIRYVKNCIQNLFVWKISKIATHQKKVILSPVWQLILWEDRMAYQFLCSFMIVDRITGHRELKRLNARVKFGVLNREPCSKYVCNERFQWKFCCIRSEDCWLIWHLTNMTPTKFVIAVTKVCVQQIMWQHVVIAGIGQKVKHFPYKYNKRKV